MKRLPRILLKTLLFSLLILGIVVFIVIDRLTNTEIFEDVSQYTEIVALPQDPFDLQKAVQEGKAFLLDYPENGEFTILWGTDFHLRRGPFARRDQVYALLEKAFEETDPNLTVISGDLLFSFDAAAMLNEFASFMEDHNRFWAYSFGNHDGEFADDRETLAKVLDNYPHALFSSGEAWVRGFSDYPLVLTQDGIARDGIILLDSHDSRVYTGDILAPDYIYPSQIAWYRWVEDGLGDIPLYTFLHIPLPEFKLLWDSGTAIGVKGDKKVNVPLENSGLFAAMQEKGNTVAVFSGHDHLNDFHGTWEGIDLHYGRSASYGSYGSRTYAKGVKTITIYADDRHYTVQTYTVDQWGL
ncbi:MAG: metallophosphoesterase [Sphaerochaetaceae bacterium]